MEFQVKMTTRYPFLPLRVDGQVCTSSRRGRVAHAAGMRRWSEEEQEKARNVNFPRNRKISIARSTEYREKVKMGCRVAGMNAGGWEATSW